MSVTTLNKVADYLLRFARDHGDLMTQLKLQKMVFYADAWYMALHDGEELIADKFEAWVHGPVARALYSRFADYKWLPITEEIEYPELPNEVAKHLEEVYEVFSGYSAYQLELMTHQEEPWMQARGSLPPSAICETYIDKDLTARFYREMMDS
ncbi:TPA: SocA family protein [Salmonella enterica]|uniref:SocA family protein n=1 Tax=Salmonella enterica TaxID=28901 RepID=A0A750HRK7_SALER|nr:SocA family protein [Salmonella enterica]HAG5257536.1 SocA family protein [Salmonella enterica]HCA3585731.1 SocA family protein [Salmonella enterica subsp. enterica serovar Java]HDI1196967.1 SocA family protein [Salmonella enterica]